MGFVSDIKCAAGPRRQQGLCIGSEMRRSACQLPADGTTCPCLARDCEQLVQWILTLGPVEEAASRIPSSQVVRGSD